jgi:hypothetical protein
MFAGQFGGEQDASHEPVAAGPPAVPAGSASEQHAGQGRSRVLVKPGCGEPRTARGPRRFMAAEHDRAAEAALWTVRLWALHPGSPSLASARPLGSRA